MAILMGYSVFTTCFGCSDTEAARSVDIVAHTTIASIFGYFISLNFVKNETQGGHFPVSDTHHSRSYSQASTGSEIGFKSGMDLNDEEKARQTSFSPASVASSPFGSSAEIRPSSNRLQIQIVGTLCLFSVIALIYMRYFVEITAEQTAALLQFRDIICGSIGFLIGMPTAKSNS